MTALLATAAGVFFAYALYIGALSGRHAAGPSEFLDGGLAIPGWVAIFGGAGVMLAGLNLHDHLLLVAGYGLQVSHVAVGLALAALTGALVRKRVWLAARILGVRTVGEAMGVHYGSVSIRLILLGILFLFSVPLAAYFLAEIGVLVEVLTGGAATSGAAIWTVAFFLFLASALGGWRGTVYMVGAQGLLLFALLIFAGGVSGLSIDQLAFFRQGGGADGGVMLDRIPGVIQFTAGIGKEVPPAGPWTAIAILSFALSLTGVVLSPGLGFLGITSETKRGFAFEQVWMTAGLGAGALLLLAPVIGAELATGGLAGLSERLAETAPLLGVCFAVLLLVSLQIGVGFFAASGAHIATIELVHRYILPDIDPRGQKLAARIALGVTFLTVALAASVTPLAAAILGGLALSLAAQLLPAYLGLCWLPWISRAGVLTGFVIGAVLVVFTEPAGLIVFEGLFLDLPWGRWPLTIHSAAWGLVFNVAFCLLVSIFTRSGMERQRRDRLHGAFATGHSADFGGRAARGAKWSLVLIWAFLALGPGAILGNSFFSRPVFSGADVALGLPSLMVWQLFFWLVGVLLVWWLAYQTRLSVLGEEAPRLIRIATDETPNFGPRRPAWISRVLGRVAER